MPAHALDHAGQQNTVVRGFHDLVIISDSRCALELRLSDEHLPPFVREVANAYRTFEGYGRFLSLQ